MKQIILELDERTAARLEEIAPARSRKRSEFLRRAIQKAIWEIEEAATEEAYAKKPDSVKDVYFDPGVWEPSNPGPARRGRRK